MNKVIRFRFHGIWVIALLVLTTQANSENTHDYVHYRLGVKYKNENKQQQAIEAFRKVLAAYPDNYNAYMHVAEIRMNQGRHRLAIYNLKKALTYNPGWGKAYKMLALAYERDRQYQNAVKELQHYLQSSDPEERDSIQTQIDRLIGIVSGKPAPKQNSVPAQAESNTPSFSPSTSQKQHKSDPQPSPRPGLKSNSVAQEEFHKGVAAYQKAVEKRDERLFSASLRHLRKAIAAQPGHPGAYYYAGLIRRRQGRNKMAKVNFQNALSYPELGHNAHFYLGKIYGEEKAYSSAVKHLVRYIQKTDYQPGKREAEKLLQQYRKALSPAEKKKITVDINELAQDELQREISTIPQQAPIAPVQVRIDSLLSMSIVDTLTDPGQAMLAGVRAFQQDNYDKAIEEFRKVLIDYPRGDVAARSLYDIGICYMKLNNYIAAENQFQQVIERYPTYDIAAQSTFLKALSYFERKELSQAEQLFRKFIQTQRNHQWVGKAYEKLGDTYREQDQHRKSVDAYDYAAQKAISAADKVYALYKQGVAYLKIGNGKRAVGALSAAIDQGEKADLFERVPDSYYKIADYYYENEQHDEALKNYTLVTRKFPQFQDTPWGVFQIANIYKNTGEYERAIKMYKLLLEKYPDDYWARQAQWKMEDAIWENEYRSVLR
ncbi:MAG: tetratricopeptide repeat protein [Chitinivibrionales bacterium]